MKNTKHLIFSKYLLPIIIFNFNAISIASAAKIIPLGKETGVKAGSLIVSDPGIPDDQCWFVEDPGFSVASQDERTTVEIGRTHFFYACDAASDEVTAQIIYKKNGAIIAQPRVYPKHPITDAAKYSPHPVAIWAPLPGMAEGDYQIIMIDTLGKISRPFDFKVILPTQPWIIVDPILATPGDNLKLYLVNFPEGGIQTVHLHAASRAQSCATAESHVLEDLSVSVNRKTDGIVWGSILVGTHDTQAEVCYGVFTDESLTKSIFVLTNSKAD